MFGKLADFLERTSIGIVIAYASAFGAVQAADHASDQAGQAPVLLEAIEVPREIGAGFIEKGVVWLDAPAGEDGVIVVIVSDNPANIAYPHRILIHPGERRGSFPIRVSENAKSGIAKFAASTGPDGVTTRMRVRAAPPQSRTLLQRGVRIRHRVWE